MKKFKAKDGKTYKFHRKWAYNNPMFCDKGKQKKKDVKYIVIHYTGNDGDTAEANANYFKNQRAVYAGAHFIVGGKGTIYQSGRLKDACYSVGGDMRSGKKGEAKYYGKCTNYNQISIELCSLAKKEPSDKQTKSCKAVVDYIKKYCPNAKTIIRHWDVNGKGCPGRMTGDSTTTGGKRWTKFKKKLK